MSRKAFTLVELLIVVGIISILAAIATINYLEAQERALRSANAANLRTLGTALQTYFTDYNRLPPADTQAGPFESHRPTDTTVGNGPAAGGSWDGVPWLLVSLGYVNSEKALFNPRYVRLYRNGLTLDGAYPRYHQFRYAYNSAGLSRGYHRGGDGNVESGTVWILRDLFVPAERGFQAGIAPSFPGDYEFPWRDESGNRTIEHVMFADFSVRLVRGGTSIIWNP